MRREEQLDGYEATISKLRARVEELDKWNDDQASVMRRVIQERQDALLQICELRQEIERRNIDAVQNRKEYAELLKAMKEIAAIPPTGDSGLMKAQNIADEASALKQKCDKEREDGSPCEGFVPCQRHFREKIAQCPGCDSTIHPGDCETR